MPPPADTSSQPPLFVRLKPRASAVVRFVIDGQPAEAHTGDTLLTALLLNGTRLRTFEFGGGDRVGFCLMGACQECWVRLADGRRLRACSTPVEAGVSVVTREVSREDGRHG